MYYRWLKDWRTIGHEKRPQTEWRKLLIAKVLFQNREKWNELVVSDDF